jgi:hypothetical protein
MSDAVVEDGLQVVSTGGLAEQTKQNMFETHTRHYITYYINVNCFSAEPSPTFLPLCQNGPEPFWIRRAALLNHRGTPLQGRV